MGRIGPSKSLAGLVLIMYFVGLVSSCYCRDFCPLQSLDIEASRENTATVNPDSKSSCSVFAAHIKSRILGEQRRDGDDTGMRLSMLRRSSHPARPERGSVESLQRSLERDLHRMSGFAEQISFAFLLEAQGSRSNFRAGFPDLTNPFGKKQVIAKSSVNTTTSQLYKFESTLESGVPFGSGEYFTDFYVGTPPKHSSVVVDTGSDLTWVQCDPCQNCYHQEGPLFEPNISSTYDGLKCNSESCISAGGFGDDPNSCKKDSPKPGVCKYFYYYGDLSNTTGEFALDTVTFHANRGSPIQIEQILFGCGHSNHGLFQGGGGVMGLGQGAISFVSQVGNLFGDIFSYCLVDRDDPYYIGSPLIFGKDEVYKRLESEFQWTLFLKNTPIDSFYYVNLTGVLVAGEPLNVPETVWQIDMEGYGGTIIDSGTTLSYFRQEAYDAIRKAFVDRISYPMIPPVPALDVCYNITGIQSPDFPSMSIAFKYGAVMDLPFKNIFIQPDPNNKVYCLALMAVQSKSMNIIGNFQQQNFHVVYDRGNARFGFTPVDCTGVL